MRLMAPVLAFLLAASPVMAANTKPALAPGKAAGVKQAQLLSGNGILLLIGVGVLVGGIILVSSGSDNNSTPTTTTAP